MKEKIIELIDRNKMKEALTEISKYIIIEKINNNKINEALELILEVMDTEEIYNNFYSDKVNKKGEPLTLEKFKELIQIDPTSKNGRKGKYGDWIIKMYLNVGLPEEDYEKTFNNLQKFDKLKKKGVLEISDINQIQSPSSLFDVISTYSNQDIRSDKEIKFQDVDIISDNPNGYTIVSPKSHKSSCEWGTNTNWCTAADSSQSKKYYDTYTSKSPLYILINNQTKQKWQIHSKDKQFMDASDSPVKLIEILKTLFDTDEKSYYKFVNYINTKGTESDDIFIFDFENMTQDEYNIYKIGNIEKIMKNNDGTYDLMGSISL